MREEKRTIAKRIENNIIYVEPNYLSSVEEYDSTGLNVHEFTPSLEDYSIYVNLEVEVRGRTVQTSKSAANRKIILSFETTPDGDTSINFLQGSKIPIGDNGATINSLTTNYTDIFLKDIERNEPSTEMFGISSIDIAYNNYMIPEVTIEFIDVRGVALFAQKEYYETNKNIDAAINGETGSDIANTFFQCFFTFPYPKFTLVAKGFYGNPVTYELTCADFRAKFDSKTGNFACTAKFVGYYFSFLNDVMLNGVVAAPYSDYIGSDYWEQCKFTLPGINGKVKEMPKLGNLLGKIKQVLEKAQTISQSDPLVQEKVNLDNKKDDYLKLETAYRDFTKEIMQEISSKKVRGGVDAIIYVNSDDGLLKSLVLFTPSDNNEEFGDYVDNGEEIEDTYESFKKLLETYNSNSSDNSLPIPEGFFDKKPSDRIFNALNNELSKKVTDFINLDIKLQHPDLYELLINAINEGNANDNSPYDGYDSVYYYTDNGFCDAISKYKINNGEKTEDVEKKIENVKDSAIAEELGFSPNVENLTRIVMAHFQTFAYMIFSTAKIICNENPPRTIERLKINNPKDVSDVINRSDDKQCIVPPFPKVVTEVRRNDVTTREEAWVGDYGGDFREKDLVHGLLNGISEVAKFAAEYENAEGTTAGSDSPVYAVMKFPLSPLDLIANRKTYASGGYDKNSINSLIGLIGIRAFQILALTNFKNWGSHADVLGKAEAYNFLEYNSLNKEMFDKLSALSEDDAINLLESNESGTSIISSDGCVDILKVQGDGYSIPFQNLSWTNIKSEVINSQNGAKAMWSEDYINSKSYENIIKKNIFTYDTNIHRFSYIVEHQLVDDSNSDKPKLDGIGDYREKFLEECKYDKEKYVDYFTGDADDFIVYKMSNSSEPVPCEDTCILPSSKEYAADLSKCEKYDMDDFKDEEPGKDWKDKDGNLIKRKGGDGFEKFLDNITLPDFTVTEFPGVSKKLVPLDTSNCASIFAQTLYYAQTSDKSKALLFLASLGSIIYYKKVINDFLCEEDKTIGIIPLPALLFAGGLLWSATEDGKKSITDYSIEYYNSEFENLSSLRYDVQKRLIKIFENWVDNGIDNDITLSSFKDIQKGMELTFINEGNTLLHSVNNILLQNTPLVGYIFSNGYKSILEWAKNELSESFFNNYVTMHGHILGDRNDLTLGFRLGVRDTGPCSKFASKLALSSCVFSKNAKYFHDSENNPEVEVDMGELKEFFNGFLEVIKEENDNTLNYSNDQISQAREPTETNKDIKIGIYRYCKMLYDKWVAGLSEEEFNENWTEKAFFDDNNKYFYFIDAYYNNSSHIKLNIGDFCDKLHSSWKNEQYSVLSFLSSVYSKNKMQLYCIQNFFDLSNKENMEAMFDLVPYTRISHTRTHPNFIVMYHYETSNYLADLSNSEYENDGFMINEQQSAGNIWPEPLKSRNVNSSLTYAIPAFGVSYGKLYQSYFSDVDISMENPIATEQSIKAQFMIASQYEAGSQTGDRANIYTYGQDLYSIYSNNSYTCNVTMMGCAWVQPLMYFVLNNIPMFRGTYLIEKVSHHIEPGNMVTKFTGVRMSNVCTRIAEFDSIRSKNDQNGIGGQSDNGPTLQEKLASVDNDCPYKVFPLIVNGESGGGIPESFLNMKWGDLRNMTKNRGVQNCSPMATWLNNDNITVGQALCAAIGAEYQSFTQNDNLMLKVASAMVCNKYHYCKEINNWIYLIGTCQQGTGNIAATEKTYEKVKDIVMPIFINGPASLVGLQTRVKDGCNVEVWNRGKTDKSKAPNTHTITLDDMRRVFAYCTMGGYDYQYIGRDKSKVGKQTLFESKVVPNSPNMEWHKAYFLFQEYNTVFTSCPSKPDKFFWDPNTEIARNNDKHISDLATGFLNALNKTAASSSNNVEIGVVPEKSTGDTIYLTGKGDAFASVFDMIINAYSNKVSNVNWVAKDSGSINAIPVAYLVTVKDGSNVTNIKVTTESSPNTSIGTVHVSEPIVDDNNNDMSGINVKFCKALAKKYKSNTAELRSDTIESPLDNYDYLFNTSEKSKYKIINCNKAMENAGITTESNYGIENESGFIGDWNLGLYIQKLHYWQAHICEEKNVGRKKSGSCSYCTGAINRALRDSGYGMKYWAGEPWNLYDNFKKSDSDFIEIKSEFGVNNSGVEFNLGNIKKGDICVMWKSGRKSPRHTCSFDGSKWISDFIQNTCNVYRSKPNCNMEWHLFRHK